LKNPQEWAHISAGLSGSVFPVSLLGAVQLPSYEDSVLGELLLGAMSSEEVIWGAFNPCRFPV